MGNNKNIIFILISSFVALLYLLPHCILEFKYSNYSPFYGKDFDIIVIDEVWAYGSRLQSYYKTGSWISDSAIYENQNKKFVIEISPQIIFFIFHLIFSSDQIYYLSMFFSITISLTIAMFFLNKLFNNTFYSFIAAYSFFFLLPSLEWFPFIEKFTGIGYSPLLKFYNYSFYFAPFLLMYLFYYLGLKLGKIRYMFFSAMFFLISIFSGAFRTIYTLLSLGIISLYIFVFKKRLRKLLIYQLIIYSMPFLLLILYIILNYNKDTMTIYKSKMSTYTGHLTLFNIISLKYFIIFILFLLLIYFINRDFLIKKVDYILIILILFLTAFLISNVNIVLGFISQPDRIIVIFMAPLLIILATLFTFSIQFKLYLKNFNIFLVILSIMILLIGLLHYNNFIFKRNYADEPTRDLINFLKTVEHGSVILTIDPFLMGYIQFFTNNFLYIPNGFTTTSDDYETGLRLGNAFKIYNFSEEAVKFYTEKRNIENLDNEYESFWTFVVHRQHIISRYHSKEETINTIKELKKTDRQLDLVRYYKLPSAMYEAIYYQYNMPQKLNYKLDYIIVGPKEGKIDNIIAHNSELVYSNSKYSIYHVITPHFGINNLYLKTWTSCYYLFYLFWP